MFDTLMTYKITYNAGCDGFNIKVELNGSLIRYLKGSNAADCISDAGLSVDESYMRSTFNIGLSSYELISFVANKYIYADFIASSQLHCMIIDESTFIQYDQQGLLNECMDLGDDWDIYFPFDRTPHNDDNVPELYKLGHVWGLDLYFLSKKGVNILYNLGIIKQSLDEEILELSMQDALNIYYNNTACYTYKENEMRHISRNEAIKRAILTTDFWEPEDKDQIRLLLKELSRIATKANVKLILSYGSLLGHIRHGGIMPWDDDVDLLILDEDIEKLFSGFTGEQEICCSSARWHFIDYYKIWLKSGKKIPNYNYTFPFIDIWIIRRHNENMITEEGVKIPLVHFFPLQKTAFENAEFYGPAYPQECLNAFYQNWRTDITIFPWRHRLEEEANFPLNAKITVDANGRML